MPKTRRQYSNTVSIRQPRRQQTLGNPTCPPCSQPPLTGVDMVDHHDNHYPRCPYWLHKHLKFLVKRNFAWKSNQWVMWGDVYGVICTIAFTDEQHYESDAQVWVPLTNKGNIADIKHHQGTDGATCCWWCTPQYTTAFNALVDQARTRQAKAAHAAIVGVAVGPNFVDTVLDGKQAFAYTNNRDGKRYTIEVPSLDDASVDSDESTDRASSVMSGHSSPSETCFTFGEFSVPIVGQDRPGNRPATRMSNRMSNRPFPGDRRLTDQDYRFTDYVVKVGGRSRGNRPAGLVIDTTTLHTSKPPLQWKCSTNGP